MRLSMIFRRPRRPSWMRRGPLRGMSLAEVSAMLLAVAAALLASCHDRHRDPDRSDPFPPGPPPFVLRGAHRLADGSVLIVGVTHER